MAKSYRFTVSGSYRFPHDMLRYDACYPADTESAIAIADSIDRTSWTKEERKQNRTFKVNLIGTVGPPTDGRWRSFSWVVIESRRV